MDDYFRDAVVSGQDWWRRVVAGAAHTYRRVDADGVFHVDWWGEHRQAV
ncbi:MAG TPA: hypothetical protein VFR74_08110 [Jiangellales bacterium]|nr:hypothetical protein [Jiangellales bacterium]